jgi:hypothetical protein
MASFGRWLDTFLEEKGIDLEETFEVEGPSGANFIPVGCIVELAKSAPSSEQAGIKGMLVRIDFANGNVRHFLKHLAGAVAR